MALTGYYIYRGVGGLADVDFTTSVGTVTGAGTSKVLAGLGHLANTTYTYVLRAVYADIESPDVSAIITFVTDGAGEWVGNKPSAVAYLEATVVAAGVITLRWQYNAGSTAAADFGVYSQATPYIVLGSPGNTVTYTSDTTYTKSLSLVDGTSYWFAVTARTTGGVESAPLQIGPFLADATAPAAPSIAASAGWTP